MLKKISYVLDRKQKINLVALLLVIFIGAFVELLGVASILPLIEAVENSATIYDKWYYTLAQERFGITDIGAIIVLLSVIMIIIYIVKNVYITFMYHTQYHFVFDNQRKLAVKMMKSYMQQDYLFHVSKNVAELQRNVTNDVNSFFTVVLYFLQFLAEISVCVVLIVFLMMQDWMTTLILAAMLGGFVLIFTKFFKKVLVKKGEESRELNVSVTKWLLQSFSGIKEIKVTNSEEFFIHNYDKQYRRMAVIQRQQSILTYMPRPIMETVCIGGLLLALIAKVSVGGEDLSSFVTVIGLFGVAAFRMLPSFNRMTGYLGGIMYNKPAIDAVYDDLIEIDKLIKKRKQLEEETLTFQNQIQFCGLSFRYPETENWILENVDLTIKKDDSIAFIGASGAGKTTVADILLGLLEPQEGTVLVDGYDIHKNLRKWHSYIGYIPQTIYLMDDTIRENILFGVPQEQADEKALQKAIREAQLESFVNSLKDGMDTVIGDRGVKLSGGQRQRIGIARALYRDPKVLILDEATSALDNETEKEVMQAIDGLHGTRTLVVIAHRLSTIKKSDRIYAVEGGKILKKDKQEILGT